MTSGGGLYYKLQAVKFPLKALLIKILIVLL